MADLVARALAKQGLKRRSPSFKKVYERAGGCLPQLWDNGKLYFCASTSIRSTNDFGVTFAVVKDFGAGFNPLNLMKTADSAWLCIVKELATNTFKIHRSTNLTTWIEVYTLGVYTSGPTIGELGWDQNGSRIFIGQYATESAATVTQINLWTSNDYGQTWTVAKTWTRSGAGSIRHIHCVRYDSYAGKFWIATGDSTAEASLLSTVDGVTFTTELGSDPSLTAVSLVFNKRYVIWGKDKQDSNDFTINMMNKTTKAIKEVGYVNNTIYYTIPHPKGYLMFDQMEAGNLWVYQPNVYFYWSEDGTQWERVHELIQAVSDSVMLYNFVVSPDGRYLSYYKEFTPNGGARQYFMETWELQFN